MAWVAAIVLIALVAVVWYFVEQPQRRDFWLLAARHPDNAYDWFVSHEGWIVVDPASGRTAKPEETEYSGPFILWVPKLGGRQVLIYGQRDAVRESQEAFIRVFGPYGDGT